MPFDTAYLPKALRNIGSWAGANEIDPSKFLPYFDHCTDDVVILKDGRLMAMIKIEPVEFYLSSNAKRNGSRRLHFALLQLLASPDVEIYEHHVCHNNVKPFEQAPGGSPYWQEFCERYNSRTLRGLKQYDWFISIIVKPNLGTKTFFGRLTKSNPLVDDYALRLLNSKVRTIMAAFRNQAPVRLGSYRRHGVLFSAIGKAVALIGTTRAVEVPYAQPEGNLGHVIYRERVAHGPLGFLIERGGGRAHCSVGRMYGLNVYPKNPRIGMFDDLMSDVESIHGSRWVMTNYINPLNRAAANDRLSTLLKRLETNSSHGATDISDIEDALNDLAGSQEVRGHHAFTLAVHADTMPELDAYGAAIVDIVAGAGCSPAAGSGISKALYWLQYPGNIKFNPSPAVIGMNPFTELSSLEGHPTTTREAGDRHKKIRWGYPIFRYENAGGGAYDHELFDGQIGHTLYCGPSQSGKTTAVGTDISAATPLIGSKGTIVALDKDRSNKLAILNNGGTYVELRRGEESGAAPLRRMNNTHQDRNVICDLIFSMILRDGNGPLSEKAKGKIAQGVAFVMRQPPHKRELGTVHAFMPPAKNDPSDAANRFKPWCQGERLGWAFDGTSDGLDFSGRLVGVDYTQLLDDENVWNVMCDYLFYLAKKNMDGRRFILIGEEFQFLLNSDKCVEYFTDFLLTGRKNNVMVWVLIQQPESLLKHRIGPAILSQCRTRKLFKNELANHEAYCGGGEYGDGLHCTPQEYRQISATMTVGRWSVLIQRPGKSVLCRFDLSSMPEDIAILSGTPDSVRHWDKLSEQRKQFYETLPEV